ncbi:MAG: polyprenyl synthetase family protein [Bacteroidales bacterium]
MNEQGDEIKQPIQSHLDVFEKKFKDSMKSNVAMLDIITRYIVKRKGKQMRPMFVFLCADINGKINESTYTAASLIELLHTATLVHDDVVDDSNERRGFFPSMHYGKIRQAVLVGDFTFKGLLFSLKQQ